MQYILEPPQLTKLVGPHDTESPIWHGQPPAGRYALPLGYLEHQPVTLAGTLPQLAQFGRRLLASAQAAGFTAAGANAPAAVAFDPEAFRAWCALPHPGGGTNAETVFGVGQVQSRDDEPARLVEEALLCHQFDDWPQQVWRTAPGVDDVRIWRSADSEGPDGGGMLTVEADGTPLAAGFVTAADLLPGEPDHTGRWHVPVVDAVAHGLQVVAAAVNQAVARYRASDPHRVLARQYQVGELPELLVLEALTSRAHLLVCCPACQWDNPTGATRCGGCGITLARDAAATDSTGAPCAECGAHIPDHHSSDVNESHDHTCSLHPSNVH